jgi:hypothetical protein
MTMSKQIEVFSLEELKEKFPKAFQRVHDKWKEGCDCPWTDEIIASMKAIVEACGARLTDWEIGAYTHCSITVEDLPEGHDKDWFLKCVLKPNKYVKKGVVEFHGLCAFTGYCADDDFLEVVWKALESGETLQKALEGMADSAQQHMEDDLTQQQEEDSMMANWDGNFYTENGTKV